ncbi:hypothetical protein E4T39_01521, partial [Aureobasidium subglaciale]
WVAHQVYDTGEGHINYALSLSNNIFRDRKQSEVRGDAVLMGSARAKLTWLQLPAVNKVRDSNNRCKAPPRINCLSTTSSSSSAPTTTA